MKTWKVPIILGMVALVLAALACSVSDVFAEEEGPPNPYCTWVDESEQVWVDPVTGTITVVDQEAWTEHVPAVTHEECAPIKACPTYTWPKQYYWQGWHLKSFGPITFTYDKSADPNKCHRPTGSSLGVPPQLMSDFNSDFDEWEDAVCVGEECVTVIDEPAYDIEHPAVTHEETVVVEEGYWKTIEGGYWDCPELCQYNPDITAGDPKCKAPETCKWTGTGFGLFLLEGPDGQLATMYVYEDKNGQLPIGIGVERQKCVLGWVAVNTPYADKVWRNTCTGEFRWNGETFTPRRDVLKDGVCQRNGECIE